MKRPQFKLIALSVIAASAAALSPVAQADTITDVAAPFLAPARIDFRIIIPGFLRFRVGTNVAGTIDQITFDMTATPGNVGNATAILGTGGDAGTSVANVSVQGNNGQVTITPTNSSAGAGLGTGTAADGFIPYTEITTTASIAQLPAPTLTNAGGAAVLPTLNAGKVTDRTGTWTYRYANTTIPSAGTYGTSVNGGRVTYTATMP